MLFILDTSVAGGCSGIVGLMSLATILSGLIGSLSHIDMPSHMRGLCHSLVDASQTKSFGVTGSVGFFNS
jgi:hypothetical protein